MDIWSKKYAWLTFPSLWWFSKYCWSFYKSWLRMWWKWRCPWWILPVAPLSGLQASQSWKMEAWISLELSSSSWSLWWLSQWESVLPYQIREPGSKSHNGSQTPWRRFHLEVRNAITGVKKDSSGLFVNLFPRYINIHCLILICWRFGVFGGSLWTYIIESWRPHRIVWIDLVLNSVLWN